MKSDYVIQPSKESIRIAGRARADYLLEMIMKEKQLNDILKFHQKTTWHYPFHFQLDKIILEWLNLVQNTDVLPEYFDKKIQLNVKRIKREVSTSKREFEESWKIKKDDLGQLLYDAFGRAEGVPTKKYPSAGALYPVIPLILILSDGVVEGISERGCYVFNTEDVELLLIQQFDDEKLEKIKRNIVGNKFQSNISVAYAIDIRRAIAKYGYRGYRHALIEVGLMSQSFRVVLNNVGLGELCWSGFNDNAITYLTGLSPRLSPIVLIQWFGR